MANAVTAGALGGFTFVGYPFNEGGQGANNRSLRRFGVADGNPVTQTIAFGSTTTVRYILCKPGVGNNASPNQTASPVGIAGQNFGWNFPPTFTDVFLVKDKATDKMSGYIHQSPPTVIASPFGAGFGNAFDFSGVYPSGGASTAEGPGVNFGEGYTMDSLSPFTLDVKFRRDRTTSLEALCSFLPTGGGVGFSLLLGSDGTIYVSRDGSINLVSGGAVGTGNHTARVVYDGTTVYIYVNGTRTGQVAAGFVGRTAEFWVGRTGQNADPRPFDGAIDEVRISNIARSTGASYVVDTVPFVVDANTTFLCDFEARVPVRRVLKAGTQFRISTFLTANTVDTNNNYGIVVNLYQRTSAGVLTFIEGGESTLTAAPSGITEYTRTFTNNTDRVWEPGDHLHMEIWVKGRGGGATGVLTQTVTVTMGDPPGVPDPGDDAQLIQLAPTATNGFRYLYDLAPTATIAPTGTNRANIVRALVGGILTSGLLRKVPAKFPTATVTSTGAIKKTVNKSFTARLTSSAVLTKTVLRTFLANLTPSGNLTKQVNRLLLATLTPTGALTKQVNRLFTATISTSGFIRKVPAKFFTATQPSTGTIRKDVQKRLTANVTPTGTLTKKISRLFTATITPTGTLTKRVSRTFTASIGSAGQIVKTPVKRVTASIASSSAVTRTYVKYLMATVTTSGVLKKQVNKYLTATVASAGNLTKVYVKNLRGFLYGPTGDGSGGGGPTIIKKVITYIFDD